MCIYIYIYTHIHILYYVTCYSLNPHIAEPMICTYVMVNPMTNVSDR